MTIDGKIEDKNNWMWFNSAFIQFEQLKQEKDWD